MAGTGSNRAADKSNRRAGGGETKGFSHVEASATHNRRRNTGADEKGRRETGEGDWREKAAKKRKLEKIGEKTEREYGRKQMRSERM